MAWASAGNVGFKGSRKSTPFAAQMAAEKCALEAMEQGVRKVDVIVKGPGSGRETAIRTIQSTGIEVTGKGIALSNGQIGEIISVSNLSSGTKLKALIKNRHQAQIISKQLN